ncbi:MAG: hypothetical protein FWE41_07680 [Coriobacteriia bacterium]|nr:hypothetical protein [Coriobacteriia bacterium]MCL2750683.1 hypothetical protein [Coriobacteriia bacterium]
MKILGKAAPFKLQLIVLLAIFAVLSGASALLKDHAAFSQLSQTLVTVYLLCACVWVVVSKLKTQINRSALIGFYVALGFSLLLMEAAPWREAGDWGNYAKDFFGAFIIFGIFYTLFLACIGTCISALICATTGRAPVISGEDIIKVILAFFVSVLVVSILMLVFSSLITEASNARQNPLALYALSEFSFALCFAVFYYAVVTRFFGETRAIFIKGLKKEEKKVEAKSKSKGTSRRQKKGEVNREAPPLSVSPMVLMIPALLLFMAPSFLGETSLLVSWLPNPPLFLLVAKYFLLVSACAFIGLIGVRKEGSSTAAFVVGLLGLGAVVGLLQIAVSAGLFELLGQIDLPSVMYGTVALAQCLLLIVPLALFISVFTDRAHKQLPVRRLAAKNTLLIVASVAFVTLSAVGSLSTGLAVGWETALFWLVAVASVWRFARWG